MNPAEAVIRGMSAQYSTFSFIRGERGKVNEFPYSS